MLSILFRLRYDLYDRRGFHLHFLLRPHSVRYPPPGKCHGRSRWSPGIKYINPDPFANVISLIVALCVPCKHGVVKFS